MSVSLPFFSSRNALWTIAVLTGLVNVVLLCAPALAHEFVTGQHLSTRFVGWMFSAEFAGYCLSGLIGRILVPRGHWRRLARGALLLAGAGNCLTAFVLPYAGLLLPVRLFAATAGTLVSVLCMASANVHPQRSHAFSAFLFGQCALGSAALLAAAPLFAAVGIAHVFEGIAALDVLAVLLIRFLPDCGQSAGDDVSVLPSVRWAPWALLRWPAVVFFYIALSAVWTFAGLLATRIGIGAIAAGEAFSVASIMGMAGSALAGLSGRKLPLRTGILIGYGTLALAIALLGLKMAIPFVLGVIFFKLAWPFLLPFVLLLLGKLDRQGEISAEFSFLAGAGLSLGPAIGGWLLSWGSSVLIVGSLMGMGASSICLFVLEKNVRTFAGKECDATV